MPARAQQPLGEADTPGAILVAVASGRRFAIPAVAVREVTRLPRLTPVPQAPAGLLGLGSFRGEVLAVLAPGDAVKASAALVLAGDARAVLAVDRVERLERSGTAAQVDPLDLAAFLRDALPERPATRRGAATRQDGEAQAEAASTVSLLCFAVAGQSFAMDLQDVEAVFALPQDLAPLPGSREAVLGTCQHQDALLGVLSLARLLDLPASAKARPMVVVVRVGTHRAGLVVERLTGVLRIAADRIDPVPAALAQGGANNGAETRIRAIARPATGPLVSLLAPDALLDDALTAQRASTVGTERQASAQVAEATRPHLLFRIGVHRLAFPLGAVERVVLPPRRLTPLPGARASVLGLATIAGSLVPLVDQSLRLTGEPAAGRERRVVVVRLGDGPGAWTAGFLVDGVIGIRAVADSALSPAPVPEDLAQGVLGGVLRLDGDAPVLVLTPEVLLDRVEADLVARRQDAA